MSAPLFLVLGSMVLAPAAGSDDLKAELKKLEGTWILISSEAYGKKSPGAGDLWVFEGNRALLHHEGRPMNIRPEDWVFKPEPTNHWLTYHFQFDPKHKPKTFGMEMQFKHEKEPSKASRRTGIYKLEGDTLTLCYAGYYDKGQLPPDFTSPKDSDRTIYVLKRVRVKK